MIRFPAFIACLFLLLGGCSSLPDTYAPPIQRQPLDASGSGLLGHYVAMNDANADAYLVSDISKAVESGTWRWAYRRPTLRFYLKDTAHLKFSMDFAIAEITVKETGPVTLKWFINGNLLDQRRYEHNDNYHFEKAVPAEFLKGDSENLVTIEPDKIWISKLDGAPLGFILTRAGFVQ